MFTIFLLKIKELPMFRPCEKQWRKNSLTYATFVKACVISDHWWRFFHTLKINTNFFAIAYKSKGVLGSEIEKCRVGVKLTC